MPFSKLAALLPAWTGLLVLAVCPPPHQAHAAGISGVNVVLTSDRAVYAPGDPITFTLRVSNHTTGPIRLGFRTAQRFDLVMEDREGREIWRWSTGRLFAQVLGAEILPPGGGEFVARATAEGKFAPGIYTVKGIIPALEGALSARVTVTVR